MCTVAKLSVMEEGDPWDIPRFSSTWINQDLDLAAIAAFGSNKRIITIRSFDPVVFQIVRLMHIARARLSLKIYCIRNIDLSIPQPIDREPEVKTSASEEQSPSVLLYYYNKKKLQDTSWINVGDSPATTDGLGDKQLEPRTCI